MNCKNCNTELDYRFLNNCPQCGCEVEQTNPPTPYPVLDLPPAGSGLTWIKRLINIAYVFAAALAGTISGAVAVYALAAMVYLALFSGGPRDSCSQGTAVAFLSIVSGGYLGTIAGSVFAVKHLPRKTAIKS